MGFKFSDSFDLISLMCFPQAFTMDTKRREHTVGVKGQPHPEV